MGSLHREMFFCSLFLSPLFLFLFAAKQNELVTLRMEHDQITQAMTQHASFAIVYPSLPFSHLLLLSISSTCCLLFVCVHSGKGMPYIYVVVVLSTTNYTLFSFYFLVPFIHSHH